MAIFSVSNTNDSGTGSLRQAINDANALSGFDVINFAGLFAQDLAHTITLGSSSLQITDNLAIDAPDASKLTVSGNNSSRVFEITSGANVDIIGLRIANGYSASDGLGAGILNRGTLNLVNSIIGDNLTYYEGGIYNLGTLSVSNSSIINNFSFTGSGIYNAGSLIVNNSFFTANEGSGIYNSGNAIVNNSTINDNTAGQGGGIYNSGNAIVNNSTINDNTAGQGGGIYNDGTLSISFSTISNNSTDEYGDAGGIYNTGKLIVTDSIINSNRGGVYRYSGTGGIYNSGNAVVSNSTISNNRAEIGGGIYNDGTFTLNNTTIDGNLTEVAAGIFNTSILTVNNSTISNNGSYSSGTQTGGGIYNSRQSATLTINNSTIRNNSAFNGGGIYNDVSATLTINNSTINNNLASYGSGISNDGIATVINSTISSNEAADYGGGIYNQGILAVVNSTILKNSSNLGGGGGIYNTQEGTATIKNSIIAGNFDNPSNVSANATSSDVAGSFITNRFNLIGNLSGSTGFNSSEQLNVPLTDVLDTILRDNGGATKTHALVVGSLAINAGLNADIPADTTDRDGNGNVTEFIPYDQRGAGFNRIFNFTVDIGAYELQAYVIDGTNNDDTLFGTNNNDIITGLRGRDILIGNGGADSFVYSRIQDLGDTITDFESSTDQIVLRKLFGNLNLSNLDYTSAIAGGYLQFAPQGSNTVVLIDPDGTAGSGRAVKLVTVENVSTSALNKSVNFAF
ncbi:choice-of-anchor Q domain-containing protein (plasmid) [Nostoc sp. UHCC 0302]|uniref:beta strand repeat-containing protein n=1 Tax=Nostoc sp. UHCC 0302 TaxID=3134896 RepID=UPI00311C8FD0